MCAFLKIIIIVIFYVNSVTWDVYEVRFFNGNTPFVYSLTLYIVIHLEYVIPFISQLNDSFFIFVLDTRAFQEEMNIYFGKNKLTRL